MLNELDKELEIADINLSDMRMIAESCRAKAANRVMKRITNIEEELSLSVNVLKVKLANLKILNF